MIGQAQQHHQVLVLGGGTGGLSVASRLAKRRGIDVAVVEPSEQHYYQPLWTLVGGGDARFADTERREADLIPAGVEWIRDGVAEVRAAEGRVELTSGRVFTYDHLVVALGIQLDWDAIPGLAGAVGRNQVCSNYDRDHVEYTWETLRGFSGGTALFTHPSTPIKCGGAPQKIMYLADDTFRRRRIQPADYSVHFHCALPSSFAVKRYADTLDAVMERRGITPHYRHELVELRPDAKVAVFEHLDTKERIESSFDMIHVTPHMSAPDVLKRSDVCAEGPGGWVDVDKHSLRHVRFPNVWALGDCSSLPTSKTGAAIRKQAPTLAANLMAVIAGREPTSKYDGYTSCPLVTGYNKLVLAEFDYDKNPQETFPFDQSKERRSMYLLKKHLLPQLYWQGMLKGRA